MHTETVRTIVQCAFVGITAFLVALATDVHVPARVPQTEIIGTCVGIIALGIDEAAALEWGMAAGTIDALVRSTGIFVVTDSATSATAVFATCLVRTVRFAGLADTVLAILPLLFAVLASGGRADSCLVANGCHFPDTHRCAGIAVPGHANAFLAGSLVALRYLEGGAALRAGGSITKIDAVVLSRRTDQVHALSIETVTAVSGAVLERIRGRA